MQRPPGDSGSCPHDDPVEAACLQQQYASHLPDRPSEAVYDRRSGLESEERRGPTIALVHLCVNDDLMSAIDQYLDRLPPEQRAALARVRAVVEELEPVAEEGESYGIPAFLYAGRPLLGFRAAKKHLSVFPFSPAAVEAVKDRLEGFDLSKGTIRFTPEQPVPEDVLADIVRARKEEIEAKR